MDQSRRSVLAALGLSLPLGFMGRSRSVTANPAGDPAPTLRFQPVEEAVRAAFARESTADESHRIEVGFSESVQAGLQGTHNARPFAGFPAGTLRIVRSGSAPGPVFQGVRLYVATVDIARVDPALSPRASRPLDFATLPPAPVLA